MNQGSNDANKDKATVELKLKVSEFVIEFSDFKIIPSAIHKYPFPEIRKILIGIPSELDHPPQI